MEKVKEKQLTMDESLIKEMIKAHWRYNEIIVRLAYQNRLMITVKEAIDLMEHFYCKAMFHGIKHRIEGRVSED